MKIHPFGFLNKKIAVWPFGTLGDLVVLNGQTVTLTPGQIYDYNNVTINPGGTLALSEGNIPVILGCKNSFINNGTVIGRLNSSTAGGTLIDPNGFVFGYTIVQAIGGYGGRGLSLHSPGPIPGGTNGGGSGGNGGGSNAPSNPGIGGQNGSNGSNGTGVGAGIGGIGNSTTTAGAGVNSPYPSLTPRPDGGSGQGKNLASFIAGLGSGGGGAENFGTAGGGGGGGRGCHGQGLYIYCNNISGVGSFQFQGSAGGNGGNGGRGYSFVEGGSGGSGGGGAGGSGGRVLIRTKTNFFTGTNSVSAGTGGAAGIIPVYYGDELPGGPGANGSSGSFTIQII